MLFGKSMVVAFGLMGEPLSMNTRSHRLTDEQWPEAVRYVGAIFLSGAALWMMATVRQATWQVGALGAPTVPDGDDALGVALGGFRDGVAGSLVDPIKAALLGAHAPIMRSCGYRSSCHYQRSALPTFASYATGMVKGRLHKPVRRDGRISKASADACDTAESTLPPKKPPAPSVKRRGQPDEAAEVEMIPRTPTRVDVHIFKSESDSDVYGLTLERSGDNLPPDKAPWTYFRDIQIIEGQFAPRVGVEDEDFEEAALAALESDGFYLTRARHPIPRW